LAIFHVLAVVGVQMLLDVDVTFRFFSVLGMSFRLFNAYLRAGLPHKWFFSLIVDHMRPILIMAMCALPRFPSTVQPEGGSLWLPASHTTAAVCGSFACFEAVHFRHLPSVSTGPVRGGGGEVPGYP